MASGRSYEDIDRMTLFDVGILFDYWRDHPTADDILKAVYKIETKKQEKPQYMDAAAAREFLRLTGGKIDGMGPLMR
jgi:hypothetical protein